MRDVNLDRLRDLAGHLRDALRQLKEIGQIPREALLGDARAINSAKYLLIVAAELKRRLVKMVRFRNLLVHLYWKVDDGEVYRVIQEDLHDFERYLLSLGHYLKAELG